LEIDYLVARPCKFNGKGAIFVCASIMVPARLALLVVVAVSAGCNPSGKVPGGPEQSYPVLIQDSLERRERADKDWDRMLDAYDLPHTQADLYPITYAPKSLPATKGGIKILAAKAPKETQESALREAAKSFIIRWKELTDADPSGMSLTESSQAGDVTHFTYQQMSYPFPIAGSFGRMTLTLGSDGTLRELDDRFIPVVDVPNHPSIDRDTAIASVVGRTLTASEGTRPESQMGSQVKIGDKAEVTASRLVVLPIEKKDGLELHLAWQLTSSKATGWFVYVDAVVGGLLLTSKNS
jgi:hypothetical protein